MTCRSRWSFVPGILLLNSSFVSDGQRFNLHSAVAHWLRYMMPLWKQILGVVEREGGKLPVLSEAWLLTPVLNELGPRSAPCVSDSQYIENNWEVRKVIMQDSQVSKIPLLIWRVFNSFVKELLNCSVQAFCHIYGILSSGFHLLVWLFYWNGFKKKLVMDWFIIIAYLTCRKNCQDRNLEERLDVVCWKFSTEF